MFQLLDYHEFYVVIEAIAWAAKMVTHVYAILLLGIVSMFIHSDVHRPFALADVLDSADDAFHKVDDPLAFAVYLVKDLIRFVRPVALKFLGFSDLLTTFVLPYG